MSSEMLLAKIDELMDKQHEVLYYGPQSEKEVTEALAMHHKTSAELQPLDKKHLQLLPTDESKVLMAQYDAKQLYYLQYANLGKQFDVAADPEITLYNEYFGGGMNSVVFQEMREARGLAADVKAAQEKWVKNRKYVYGILGDIQDLDLNYLKTLGPIRTVSQEEIFGY